MTSSLVGSEMCIRDSFRLVVARVGPSRPRVGTPRRKKKHKPDGRKSVSYTHLTLPTICSV
eukprot:11772288-Prorocentrum_lima.AAC.1